MSRRREIIIPAYQTDKDHEANNQITYIKRLCTINYMPTKHVDEYLDIIAANNAYHPIIEALKVDWDGVDRLNNARSFYDTIECAGTDEEKAFAKKLIATWMRGAVAAAHSIDGFSSHGVLVIQGEQGIGKTAWCRRLDPLDCGAYLNYRMDVSRTQLFGYFDQVIRIKRADDR